VMQFACSDTAGRVGVRTRLMHSSGEFLEETIYLDVSEEKGKSRAQVAGSIITYLRRYAQSALLNLYADEDADGNADDSHETYKNPAGRIVAPKPTSTPAPPPKASRTDASAQGEAKGSASPNPESCKARFLEIVREKKWEPFAWKLFVDESHILPNEKLEDAPVSHFPTTKDASEKMLTSIKALMDQYSKGGISQELAEAFDAAYYDPGESAEPEQRPEYEPWMDVELHFGPQKGTKLVDLDRKKLWGWAKNYEPKPYKGKVGDADAKLRKALDNALSWLNQHEQEG